MGKRSGSEKWKKEKGERMLEIVILLIDRYPCFDSLKTRIIERRIKVDFKLLIFKYAAVTLSTW